MAMVSICNVARAVPKVSLRLSNNAFTRSYGDCNPCNPSLYDCRKYGHRLPDNSLIPPFEPLFNIPTGIFRCTSGETLGSGANKCGVYKNPEYFSYQHMTYYDMHMILRCCRLPSGDSRRKPI